MLQAFVSLREQELTQSKEGFLSILDKIARVSYATPTRFYSSINHKLRSSADDSLADEAFSGAEWVAMTGDSPSYFHCTLTLPTNKYGTAAFIRFEEEGGATSKITVEKIISLCKNLNQELEPYLIRVGDSVAREKLKSHHGLVLLPGLGRIEWLQIFHQQLTGTMYSQSELVTAPAYETEILPNGSVFLRVYNDPWDYESDETVTLANFIPGYMAGTAVVDDPEKEKNQVRMIEQQWNLSKEASVSATAVLEGGVADKSDPGPKRIENGSTNNGPDKSMEPTLNEMAANAAKPLIAEEEISKQLRAYSMAPVLTKEEPELPKAVPKSATLDKSDKVVVVQEAGSGPPTCEAILAAVLENEPALKITASHIRFIDELDHHIIYRISNPSELIHFYLAFQIQTGEIIKFSRNESFVHFLQMEQVGIEADRLDEVMEFFQQYHQDKVEILQGVESLDEKLQKLEKIDRLASSIQIPEFSESEGHKTFSFWVFYSNRAVIEKLSIAQYEDWPYQFEVNQHIEEVIPKEEIEVPDAAMNMRPEKEESNMGIIWFALIAVIALVILAYFVFFNPT